MEQKNSVRVGVYIDKALLKQCDGNIVKTNARSRSEFISNALEMYIAWLNSKETSKVLTPALESVIGAKIADTENRIARVLFKQGVELAMMMHVVAANYDIDENSLNGLRKLCVDEVSKFSGRYKFDDAVKFQRG